MQNFENFKKLHLQTRKLQQEKMRIENYNSNFQIRERLERIIVQNNEGENLREDLGKEWNNGIY